MHTPSVDTLNRRASRMFLAIRGESRPYVFQDHRGLWTVVTRDGARHFLHRRWAYKHAATRCPRPVPVFAPAA